MERFLEYAEKVKNPPAAPAGPVLKIEKSTAEQQFLAERFGMPLMSLNVVFTVLICFF